MKYKNQQVIEEFRKRFPKVEATNRGQIPGSGSVWKMGIIGSYSIKEDIEQFLDEQLTKKEEEMIENLKMKELPEFYEQAIKVTYGWAQDLDVDDARIGYNQAVKELNKKIEQLKTQTKR